MSFSTYEFIFIFFPSILILYYALPRIVKTNETLLQRIVLLLGASVFILSYSIEALILIAVSLSLNYWGSKIMIAKKSKIVLFIMLFFNIALLGYFKYCNFFIDNINYLFKCNISEIRLFLPLGISFYTFQQIAYIVGVYHTGEKINTFLDYAVFVSFFPKVISGPLLSHSQAVDQFARREKKTINYDNLSCGLYLFCIGLFKKTVISDTVALFADTGFAMAGNLSFFQAWITALSYSFQIYFDFSGYSDMAVGVARMLGIHLPFNFDSPYQSKSITEFWKRWHITLNSLLRQLIYIPLGGNRKGTLRTYFNVIAVFLISGLWHGASWTFILWGLFHGVISCLERLFRKYLAYIPCKIRQLTTFLIATLLWVMFRADSVTQCFSIYKNMFSFSNMSFSSIGILANDGIIPFPNMLWSLYIMLIFSGIFCVLSRKKNSNVMYKEFTPSKKNMIFVVFLFAVSVIHLSRLTVFVYSNF